MGDLSQGLEGSTGDPRVLFAMNLVLSAGFAALVVRVAAIVGITPFSWGRVAAFALVVAVLTYVVIR